MNIDGLLTQIGSLLNELKRIQAEQEAELKVIIPKVMSHTITVEEIIHEYDRYASRSDKTCLKVERLVKLILFNPYVGYGRCNVNDLMKSMDEALYDIAHRKMKASMARQEMVRLMIGMQMQGI